MGDDGMPVRQVTVQGSKVTIDGAEAIEDLEAVNGVIHVVIHVVDGILWIGQVELEEV
jgi:hypothetical protein